MPRRHWPHNLPHNKRNYTPATVLFLDTETAESEAPGGANLTLAQWVACTVRRRNYPKRWPGDQWTDGTDMHTLAEQVHSDALHYGSLWVYAHNLNFDLTVTRLPELLVRRGYRLTRWNLNKTACYFRLNDRRHTVTIADSWSIMPESLTSIAHRLGRTRVPLKRYDGNDELIYHRCRDDVDVLREAMLGVMDWWDVEDCGNWSVTGPACGWSVFRHKLMPHKVVIDPDPERRKLERSAVYQGRAEAFHIGSHGNGNWFDLDFEMAHATAAQHMLLPYRCMGTADHWSPGDNWQWWEDVGGLGWCTVTTDKPSVPVRIGGHVYYPTGTFRTCLAWPELAPLIKAGQATDIGPIAFYRLRPIMAEWAQWVTRLCTDSGLILPPAVPAVAKAWTRSVIGKWLSHAPRSWSLGPAGSELWQAVEGITHGSGASTCVMDIGGERIESVNDQEGQEAFPAVWAFIESFVRTRLGAVIDAAAPATVLACNTDGLVLHMATGNVPARLQEAAAPFKLTVKREAERVIVHGPNHLRFDDKWSIAGVPEGAQEVAPSKFVGELWPGIGWQLSNSRPGVFHKPVYVTQRAEVSGTRYNPWRGGTIAPHARIGADGATELVPWKEHPAKAAGRTLRAEQPALLRRTLS